MVADILAGLAAANLAGGAGILVVLVLRPLVRPRFGARATYALWAAPAVAALTAAIPHRGASAAAAPFVATAQAASRALPHAATHGSLLPMLLLAVWLAGALATAAWLSMLQARFVRTVRDGAAGPALVGVIRPRIVTPADFERRFAAEERSLILAHEGAHLASGDAVVNALACAVQCAGWFNPLVHLAVRGLRIDQELACDAAVIDRFPEARKTYAALLLKTQLAAQAPPLGCAWPASGRHPLKERIAMLKSALPARDMRIAGLATAALLGLGAAGLAWSASAQAPRLITQPDWIEKPTAADVARLYPLRAKQERLGYMGTMLCHIDADGRLSGCQSEQGKLVGDAITSPDDYNDFKAAMVELGKRFRMAPKSKDGVDVAGGQIRIPVIWRLPS